MTTESDSTRTIEFWYGQVQHFGHVGRTQRWVNVLGCISGLETPKVRQRPCFSLNGGPERALAVGSDLHRLAKPGDFNVELDWDDLREENEVTVLAGGTSESVRVVRRPRKAGITDGTAPLTVFDAARGGSSQRIADAFHVVDGKWIGTAAGVRTAERYYDRILSFGDESWTDYEVTAEVTIHAFDPPAAGPPTYDATHLGITLRWRGHHADGYQPSRKWYPLGAAGELSVQRGGDEGRWRILPDDPSVSSPVVAASGAPFVLGKPIILQARVQTQSDGSHLYAYRRRSAGSPENSEWDVQYYKSGGYDSGSACLVAHHTDVTVHRCRVRFL